MFPIERGQPTTVTANVVMETNDVTGMADENKSRKYSRISSYSGRRSAKSRKRKEKPLAGDRQEEIQVEDHVGFLDFY